MQSSIYRDGRIMRINKEFKSKIVKEIVKIGVPGASSKETKA